MKTITNTYASSSDSYKLVYIGGHGRSGSTLLERMLGQFDDCIAVGELRHIWEKSFAEDQLCSCGQPFSQCEFWGTVFDDAFGGFSKVELDEVRSIKNSVDRVRHIPKMLFPLSRSYTVAAKLYRDILIRLYRSIARVSGKRTIIDSSKDVSSAFFLATFSEVDLYLLHLVRDSRAVAYSWLRKKNRPEIVHQKKYMARYPPSQSALEWTYRNFLIQLLQYRVDYYQRIRYEDLVEHPEATLKKLSNFLGHPAQSLDFVHGDTIHLQMSHTVAGNPFRFEAGDIKLALDAEWRSNMRKRDKWLVTGLSYPLLYQYRYPLLAEESANTAPKIADSDRI